MNDDDLTPRRQPSAPRNLELMSVEALEAYIADLETEIARARAAIAGKITARRSADTFFRST